MIGKIFKFGAQSIGAFVGLIFLMVFAIFALFLGLIQFVQIVV